MNLPDTIQDGLNTIRGFLNTLRESISDFVSDKLGDFIAEHRQTVIIAAAAVCLFLLLLSIVLYMTAGGKGDAAYPLTSVPVSAEEILFPPEPGAASGLILSKEPGAPWGDAELERWYTEPDGTMLEDLKQSNDALISNIWEMIP
ncbi:MAG: hypothetical protein LBU99_00245 [Spirochaetaceae bacterium]|nr:hypothetical protein [Spirochaetaceae bacterium]